MTQAVTKAASKALAFDVYGTLIDTAGVTAALQQMIGERAAAFSDAWRQKQLEYTWRYSLMDAYQDFRHCTQQALEFCCAQWAVELDSAQRARLLQNYLTLPVFDDVVDGLRRLQAAEVSLSAFSNGVPADLESLLRHAGIRDFFDRIVSVDAMRSFKPDPIVYRYFAEQAQCALAECWLISSNAFDVCGARQVGMQAVWVQRNRAVAFDPWQTRPNHTVHSLAQVAELFQSPAAVR